MLARLGNVICYAGYGFGVLCFGLGIHDPKAFWIAAALGALVAGSGRAIRYVLAGE